MTTCHEVLLALDDTLSEPGSEDLRRSIEKHLAGCVNCSVIYDSTRKMFRLITESGSFDIPDDLTASIMSKIRGSGGPVDPD